MREHRIWCDRCKAESRMLTGDEDPECVNDGQRFDFAKAASFLAYSYGGPQKPKGWTAVDPPNGIRSMDVCGTCTDALKRETNAAFLRWVECK